MSTRTLCNIAVALNVLAAIVAFNINLAVVGWQCLVWALWFVAMPTILKWVWP